MAIFSKIMELIKILVMSDGMSSLVTFLVGLVALVVYWMTKRHERKSAATMIVMDIRHAEQVVVALLERGVLDRGLKNIIHENNWAKYKHLFASILSSDEFASLNRFFESCVEIAEAKRRMNDLFYATLNAKAVLLQQKMLEIEDVASKEGQEARENLIKKFGTEEYIFDPSEPKQKVLQHLNLLGRPSGSSAFVKLKKIAEMRY